jgi:hypothetical protein
MQIDFHHAVTYVIARLAGFEQDKARTIAHAAQYVDDATNNDLIKFDNEALFKRICSSHKMYSPANMINLDSHRTWLPFHFLPGNEGRAAGTFKRGKFINKIICRPDSHVAQDMVRRTIEQQDRPYGLHRLGVSMHVYADTWAHQGFAGVLHDINKTEDVEEQDASGFFDKLKASIRDFTDDLIPPLGHGQAGTFPDMPFLKWEYKNGDNQLIQRDNTEDFVEAANHMCIAMQRYIAKDAHGDVPGMSSANQEKLRTKFKEYKSDEGETRHEKWVAAIKNGDFPEMAGDEPLEYIIGNNSGSWKFDALGIFEDEKTDYDYPEDFLTSDWKKFHDAIYAHRFQLIHEILPRYGICVA